MFVKSGSTVKDLIDELNKIEDKDMPFEVHDRDGETGGLRIDITKEDANWHPLLPKDYYLIVSSDG